MQDMPNTNPRKTNTYISASEQKVLTTLESVFMKKPGVESVIANQKSHEGFLPRGASRRGTSLGVYPSFLSRLP
jgi:hypothetical protein